MIVTFKQLGNYGRLGNGLFQVAATIGYAKKHNLNYVFPKWEHSHFFQIPQETFKDLALIKTSSQYDEPGFGYSEIPFRKDCNLHGYFQSWKYFSHCEAYIRGVLSPRQEVYKPEDFAGLCSIHVRRTDYLKFPNHHPTLDMRYYEAAMERVPVSDFVVFSDDVDWCKNNFKNSNGKNIVIQNVNSHYTDFGFMTAIEHSIIANSSFSWWAAWLGVSVDKVVVAPKNWFGPALTPTHPTNDLIPPNWILI